MTDPREGEPTSEGGRTSWRDRRKKRRSRPLAQCEHCGHVWRFGPHDNTACEVGRLRREVAALRAEMVAHREEDRHGT